jgi:hypothetical protein
VTDTADGTTLLDAYNVVSALAHHVWRAAAHPSTAAHRR